MKPYPLFLIGLERRHCLVIGGGSEAEFKVRGLLDCEATVTVISPRLTEGLQAWSEQGRLTWIRRDYQPGDLQGAFLVIAERGDPARAEAIYREAEAEKALVTVMDDIPHCSAVAGSVVRQGALTIAISTAGAAPALAVRLRQKFEAAFGPEYGHFLAWMQALRPEMAAAYPAFSERRRRWYDLIDSDVLSLIEAGEFPRARTRIAEISGLPELENALPLPAGNGG